MLLFRSVGKRGVEGFRPFQHDGARQGWGHVKHSKTGALRHSAAVAVECDLSRLATEQSAQRGRMDGFGGVKKRGAIAFTFDFDERLASTLSAKLCALKCRLCAKRDGTAPILRHNPTTRGRIHRSSYRRRQTAGD
jgi:hypothetical protein